MTNLVTAYQNDDITEFEKILRMNRSDRACVVACVIAHVCMYMYACMYVCVCGPGDEATTGGSHRVFPTQG